MRALLNAFWNDEKGFVVSAELVLVSTICVIALVVGLTQVSQAVNNELRDVILREPSITAMRKIIDQGLFTTLAQSGWRLISEGATSLDEVDHVAGQG